MASDKTPVVRERDIEAYLKMCVSLRGGEIRKVKWIGRRGAPDRLVMMVDLGYSFYVELKRPGKKPTRQQEREHALMRRAGITVEVIDSFTRVDEVLP